MRIWFLIVGAIVGTSVVLVAAGELFPVPEKVIGDSNKTYQYAAPWDREMYEGFYKRIDPVIKDLEIIKGGIVPHHLLAGHLSAVFFSAIAKQRPSTIVLISPNHFNRGSAPVIATNLDWQTPYGIVKTDHDLTESMVASGLVRIDEDVVKEEHGLYVLPPFIRKSLPQTRMVSLMIKEQTSSSTIDRLANSLADILPADAVVVASVDFSHYQTAPVANFHDEYTRSIIKSFDYERLAKTEIDSTASVRLLLKLMESKGAQKVGFELHTNAAELTRNPSATNITSYYSPYFVFGDKSTATVVSLLNFGDLMLDRNVKKRIDENGEDFILEKLAGEENRFFRGMDIIAANLEGSFADSRRATTKSIAFRFDPKLIAMLQRYNFSLFNTANNHSFDMSAAGFAESKKNLDAAGIDSYGRQYRADDSSLLIKDIGGVKIAFLGLDDSINPITLKAIQPLIDRAVAEARHLIVNIHWGAEYQELSNDHQRDLARELIDAGADAIIGHHPHVVEEIEVYKDKPIFYSLGNFVFDQYFSIPTQQGLAVGVVLGADATSVYVFPIESENSQVRLMPPSKAEQFMRRLIDRSRLGEYNIDQFHFSLPQL